MRWRVLFAGGAAIGVWGTSWAVQAGQPTQPVVVVTRDLPAGHRLTRGDVRVAPVPVGGGRGGHLLPASVSGLVPGEYLSRPILAGMPLRDDQIRPARSTLPVLTEPAGADCPLPA